MPLDIVRNDLCLMAVDAVVNSANPHPIIGSGVDSALHEAAGPSLIAERQLIGDIAVGQAAVTKAGRLPARYVIHTVGPLWRGGNAGELADVSRCYRSCLEAAVRLGCKSIAFPLISTGTYGFPKDLALRAATEELSSWLDHLDIRVFLVVYDDESFRLSKNLFNDVASYLERRFGESLSQSSARAALAFDDAASTAASDAFDDAAHDGAIVRKSSEGPAEAEPCAKILPKAEKGLSFDSAAPNALLRPTPNAAPPERSPRCASRFPLFRRRLEDVVGNVDKSFADTLLRLIDERGMTDPQVYRRANIDRKLFSKIRSSAGYRPSKATALALAVALMLNLDETRDLIGRAGYALTHANRGDIIVEYFIENEIWDIVQINEALFAFGEPLIGR